MKILALLLFSFIILSCGDKSETFKAPEAAFTIGSNDGKAPEEIKFTNSSTDAEDYVWFFGDGQASEEFSPKHNYKTSGTYTVKLKVFGQGGKDSALTQFTLAPSGVTYYNVKNSTGADLDNVRSFYLDWDASKVYDIVDHGKMLDGDLTDDFLTTRPSIEVLFYSQNLYFLMLYPDPIIENETTTITIYDTSYCEYYESDPISSASIMREDTRKKIRIGEFLK
jgi:PKD repeat protein